MDFNIEMVNDLIRNRRSIYPQVFSGEMVADEIINEMLENANWAPTHKLTEPWRFVVFKGEGLKKLAAFQAELYKELSGDQFDQTKFEKLATKPLKCSHVIAIGAAISGRVPEIEEVEATACAVQNMYLTATAYQIGCYWGSGGITYKKEANSFFGLEEKDMLLGFMFIGQPKIAWPQGRRQPLADKVKWVEE